MEQEAAAANKRGLIGNALGLSTLFGLAYALGIVRHAVIALGIQYAVFFAHGLPYRSEKFYDLSGSVTHFALVFFSLFETQARTPRQTFLALASTVWLTRLGTFLYLRVLRDGKDQRFDPVKPYALRFAAFWTIQALWVFLIQLPVILVNSIDDRRGETSQLRVHEIVLIALWFLAFAIEYIADTSKMAFRNKIENRHAYITDGVWSLCRHPNYFGEILMWVCQAAIATIAAFDHEAYHLLSAWLSPAFTALLLFKVSGINLVAAAGMKKWGKDKNYLHYINNTSLIIPWFPAKPLSDGNKEK